jgi:hypothetical protein
LNAEPEIYTQLIGENSKKRLSIVVIAVIMNAVNVVVVVVVVRSECFECCE